MRRTCVLAVATAATLLPVLTSGSAQALSCVGPDLVIAEADQVFTGRIVDAADGRLLLEVEEVWKGGPVEEKVWMDVDLPGWSEWADGDGEVPDGYSSPDRWVFAPYEASVGPCTAWRSNRELVRDHAPDRADAPVPDGTLAGRGERPAPDDDVPVLAATGVGLGGGAVLAAAALLLLRRRSPRRRSRRHPG